MVVVSPVHGSGVPEILYRRSDRGIFGTPVQLDVEIKDRFGNQVRPREWFLVPLFVVNEVVERIKDGTITQYVYDPTAARLVKAAS